MNRYSLSFLHTCIAVAAISVSVPEQLQAREHHLPDVPQAIQVPRGHKINLRAEAEGVQIYVWDGAGWLFQAPEATLYLGDRVVAIHYAGPTWESLCGSKVVAARIDSVPSPNPNSIPMLLLRATATEGSGVFARTTYIQRLNTVGGLPPLMPGAFVGEEAHVPYTAEYLFYRRGK